MKTYDKYVNPSEIVTQRRSELMMTQSDLARKLDYPSVNFISMLETGRSKVPLEKAVEIAVALEMDKKWFVQRVIEDRYPVVAKIIYAA